MPNLVARKLRKTMTPHEIRLWSRLRLLRTEGHHFRRQVPLEGYVVDFACFSARLIVEVDGGQHAAAGHARRDVERDARLTAEGFRVLRVWNSDIDDNIDGVMEAIAAALNR
jgi:very-short-patch-repair endonuclease